MSKFDDGGAAFPDPGAAHPGARPPDESKGVSLWDHYAASVLGGLMAAQIHGFNDQPASGPFAEMAAKMADAMLAERRKRFDGDSE